MRKKHRKKLPGFDRICIVAVMLFFVAGCFFAVKNIYNKSEYGKISKASGKYDTVYCLTTKYSDTEFYVSFDDENPDGSHEVTYSIAGTEDTNLFSDSSAPNQTISRTISSDEYASIINGFEIFEDSEKVTSVVVKTKNGAYGFQYVSSLSEKDLGIKSLSKVNHPTDSLHDHIITDISDLDSYLEKNNFKKYVITN